MDADREFRTQHKTSYCLIFSSVKINFQTVNYNVLEDNIYVFKTTQKPRLLTAWVMHSLPRRKNALLVSKQVFNYPPH